MYPTSGQLILAFHGCDQTVKTKVLSRKVQLRPSENTWDWLGHGVYFWEADPQRAMDFARVLKARPKSKLKNPCVLGAVLDLGNCLNLLNQRHLKLLKRSYVGLKTSMKLKNKPMPVNKSLLYGEDLLLRDLTVLPSTI